MVSTLPWQRLLRRDLLVLYLVIFLADVVVGYILPLFPLLARDLGASLALIGVLAAFNGATQVVVSVPIGMLSDRFGRKLLVTTGPLCFVAVALLLALGGTAWWFLLAQVMLGVGIVATFAMGAAMIGDHSAPAERGLAMGMLTTSMGLGFAVGPLLGGLLAEAIGARGSLLFAAALALGCALLAWGFLADAASFHRSKPVNPLRNLRLLAASRPLLLAALAHLLLSPIFNGAVINFVPVKAGMLGFTAVAIGSLFTVRALASTVTRLPIGAISTPGRSYWLMLLALALGGGAMLILASQSGYGIYMVALAVEGVSFGMFLTAGQAFVTHNADTSMRGAALGAYNMAGGISAALSPIVLGLLAQAYGLDLALFATSILVLTGAAVLAIAYRRTMAAG